MVIIDRGLQNRDRLDVQEVFEVEDHVLAVADALIHADTVQLDDLPPVELVPQYAEVEVRRAEHHLVGVGAQGEDASLFDGALFGHIPFHDAVEVAHHELGAACLHLPHHELGRVHGQPVVHIRKLDIGAARLRKPAVAGGGDAAVFLVDELHTAVARGDFPHELEGAVPAPVVHQDQLQLRVVLTEYALRAALHALLPVIHGYDDADFFHAISPF